MNGNVAATPSGGIGPKYSFPLLGAEEIVAALEPLGLDLNVEDLRNPTHSPLSVQKIQDVYRLTTRLLMSDSQAYQEYHDLPTRDHEFLQSHGLDYPELYKEAIPLFSLLRDLSKLMEICLVPPPTTLDDLTRPDTGRLRRNLSAIINFAKFRDDCVDANTILADELNNIVLEKDNLEEEKRIVENALSTYRMQAQGVQTEIDDAKKRFAELELELQDKFTQMDTIQKEIEKSSQMISSQETQMRDERNQLQLLRQEKKRLLSQRVQSPARTKSEFDHETRNLETLRHQIEEMEKVLLEYESNRIKKEKDLEEIHQTIVYANEVESMLKKLSASEADKQSKKNLIEKAKLEIEDLKALRMEQEQVLTQANEFTQRKMKSFSTKLQDLQDRLSLASQQKKELEKKGLDETKLEESAKAELASILAQIDMQNSAHIAAMEEKKRAWKILESHVEEYNHRAIEFISLRQGKVVKQQ